MFTPSDDLTNIFSPGDNRISVHLVQVTNNPSPYPKVDELFIHPTPKTKHLYPKSRTNCHNVTVQLIATLSAHKL